MNNLIEEVLKSGLFTHFASKLSEEERQRLEESIADMLSSVSGVHDILLSKLADQKGIEEFTDALDKIITDKGNEEWPQDKN